MFKSRIKCIETEHCNQGAQYFVHLENVEILCYNHRSRTKLMGLNWRQQPELRMIQ